MNNGRLSGKQKPHLPILLTFSDEQHWAVPRGAGHLHLLKDIGSMPRLSQAVGVGEAGFGGPLPWCESQCHL